MIPAGFSIYPLRRRIALLSGRVLFRNAATTERGVVETDPAEIEAVFARDRWDVRTIPGLRCQDTWQAFVVDFSGVPQAFREDVKAYIRMTLTAKDQTAGYALRETRVGGLTTTLGYLQDVIADPRFQRGAVGIDFRPARPSEAVP